MSSIEPTTPVSPPEDVIRGTLFALIALPLGIAAWLLIWSIGFIASIVAFAVAFAAVWLYRKGSRGRVSIVGAFIVTGITVVTLLVAFFAGMVLDAMNAVVDASGMSWSEVLALPQFWDFVAETLPAAFGDYALNFVMAIGFGVLGCFAVLRGVFAQAKRNDAAEAAVVPAGLAPEGTPGEAAVPSESAVPSASEEPAAPAASVAPGASEEPVADESTDDTARA